MVRLLLSMGLGIVLAASIAIPNGFAADQKVTLMLGGKHCDSYLSDVETALMKVPGVKKADVKSMPGHAVVEMDTAKSKPDQAVKAVNEVKGSGYNCTAELMK